MFYLPKMKFSQPAYPTSYFSNEVFVKCPKCAGRAYISSELRETVHYRHLVNTKVSCGACGFTSKSVDDWFGFYQGHVCLPCGYCGNHISHNTNPVKKPFEQVAITCFICKQERNYKPTWHRFKEDKPTDPYFGLELWLQTEIKGHIIWAYNRNHLEYLKEYIGSKLREDNDRNKYSMITNLPQWVKNSKNRDIVLRAIEKMAHKVD